MTTPIPLCACGCTRPAAPNSPFYFLCKMIKDGWNESTGEYEEIVPFAHPTGDEGQP